MSLEQLRAMLQQMLAPRSGGAAAATFAIPIEIGGRPTRDPATTRAAERQHSSRVYTLDL